MLTIKSHLATVREARRAQYAELPAAEQAAIIETVSGSCEPKSREYASAAIRAIFAGDSSVLNLDLCLTSAVPPSLERLGRLVDLRVLDLSRCELSRLPDYIGELGSLQSLVVETNRLTTLPSAFGKLQSLERLSAHTNQLLELPEAFVELQNLQFLGIYNNQLTALPAWLAALPKLQTLQANNNPLQLPPRSMCDGTNRANCLADVRRYFASLAKHGATTSRRVKLVLAGAGLAGKTSTLRGLQRDCAPSPADKDARTVQLDIWTLVLGDVVVSAWDFAGQPEYAAAQQAYLVDGALYLLLVPAHRAMDEDAYPDVLGRWLDTLQARAPGAVVQVVLSHGDEVAAPGMVEVWSAWLAEWEAARKAWEEAREALPRPKVGERVEIVGVPPRDESKKAKYIGQEGEVVRVDDSGLPFNVKFADGQDLWFRAVDVAPVAQSEARRAFDLARQALGEVEARQPGGHIAACRAEVEAARPAAEEARRAYKPEEEERGEKKKALELATAQLKEAEARDTPEAAKWREAREALPRPKVGERVEIVGVRPGREYFAKYIGQEGEVVEVSDGGMPFNVKFADGKDWWFRAVDVAPAAQSEARRAFDLARQLEPAEVAACREAVVAASKAYREANEAYDKARAAAAPQEKQLEKAAARLNRATTDPASTAEEALSPLLTPAHLASAAAEQVAWVRDKIAEHATRIARLRDPAEGEAKALAPLRVQPTIPVVCAGVGGGASLMALRELLTKLVQPGEAALLPSSGFVIPGSWLPALALPAALRDGRDPLDAARHAMRVAERAASKDDQEEVLPPPPADPAMRRPYVPLRALRHLWLDDVAPRTIPDESSPDDIFADALALLANQGDVFLSGGLVFLDPAFATELLKPLVDHRLSRERAEPHVEEHVRATLGATLGARASRSAVEQLLRAVEALKLKGMLREPLLPFLWRGTALRAEDYPHAIRMLCESGVLFELPPARSTRSMERARAAIDAPTAHPTFVPVGAGPSLPIFAWDPSTNQEQWGMLLQTVGTSLTEAEMAAALRAFCGGSRRMFVLSTRFAEPSGDAARRLKALVERGAISALLGTGEPSPCFNPNADNINYDLAAAVDDTRMRDDRWLLIWQSFAACAKDTGGRMLQLVDSALGLSPMQRAEKRFAGILGLDTIVVNIDQLAPLELGSCQSVLTYNNAGGGGDAGSRQWAMPMRLPKDRPGSVGRLFRNETLEEGQTQIGLRFDFHGNMLPPGVIERCVAAGVTAGQVLECWYGGVLVADPLNAARTKGLLELTTSGAASDGERRRRVWLEIEARGACEVPGLWRLLTPLRHAVRNVLEEYPGVYYAESLLCPRCRSEGRWTSPTVWSLEFDLEFDLENGRKTHEYCQECDALVEICPPRHGQNPDSFP